MFSQKEIHEKGIVLLIALGTILVVTLLADVIIRITLTQAKFTHHQTSRIQAYYAALAGMNYAVEKLRVGTDVNWPLPTVSSSSYTRSLCRSGCNINDTDLPIAVQQVNITVKHPSLCTSPSPPTGIKACISTATTYTSPAS